MLRLEEVLQLKDGEDIRLIVKRHGIVLLPGLFTACLLIAVPFFFLFKLFGFGLIGAVVFLLFVLTGLIMAWRTFAMWDGDALIVSTTRLVRVIQSGIFSRTVNEIPLSSILEVSWTKNGLQALLFNLGTVRVVAGQELSIKQIPRPKQLHALIMDLSNLAKKSHVSDQYLRVHRLEKIRGILEKMDDQALRELEKVLSQDGRVDDARERMKAFEPVSTKVTSQEVRLPVSNTVPDTDDAEIRIKTLFGEDRTTRLKLMDD